MDVNAAGAGLDAHRGPAATDLACYVVVIHGSVAGNLPIAVNAASARSGIERERRAACPEFDAPRAGLEPPLCGRRSAGFDTARAGLGMQPAMQIPELDGA